MPDQLQSIVQKMIDAGESEETIATAIRGYKPEAPSQGQVRSRTGQMYTPYTDAGVKEFATGAKNAVVDTLNPMTYARLGKRAFTDPLGLAKDAAMMPLRVAGGLVTDPAETLGGLSAGLAMGAVAPLSKGPVLKGVGTALETTGKRGGWPIRMMGAHQLGSGNPLGAALIAAPDAMMAGGKALKKMAGEVPEAEFPSGARNVAAKFTPNAKPILAEPSAAPTTPRVPMALGDAGPINEPVSSSSITPAERAKLVKQGYTPEMIAKLEKADAPKGAATVSPKPLTPKPPVDESGGVTFDPSTDRQGELLQKLGGKPEAAKPLGLNTGPAHMGAGLKELGTKGSEQFRTDQFQKNAPLVEKAGVTGDRLPLGSDGLKAAQEEKAAFAQREVGQHAPTDIDTANPHEKGLKDLGERPAIAHTKSHAKAGKSGMSHNDVGVMKQFILDNPDATTEEIAAHVDAEKAGRRTANYSEHRLNAEARRAADADRDPR